MPHPTMRSSTLLSLLLAACVCSAVWSSGGSAQDAITQCDRLASHPLDPDRVTTGVPTAEVDQDAAIAACQQDLSADPDNPRLTYQLARVYFYNGRTQDAVSTITRAAEAGYRQAQFVLGALIANNRPDAPTDICEAERWWALSARAGRQAARVSYVRHVTKELFDGCTLHASVESMENFLAQARERGGNYYFELLLADLTEDLAAYKANQ